MTEKPLLMSGIMIFCKSLESMVQFSSPAMTGENVFRYDGYGKCQAAERGLVEQQDDR